MRAMLDPKRDLMGATPEKLGALLRPLRPRAGGQPDPNKVQRRLRPTRRATVPAFEQASLAHEYCGVPQTPARSDPGVLVIACGRFPCGRSIDQNDSIPLVWAIPCTYSATECFTDSWS